jgi:hypothetical protein
MRTLLGKAAKPSAGLEHDSEQRGRLQAVMAAFLTLGKSPNKKEWGPDAVDTYFNLGRMAAEAGLPAPTLPPGCAGPKPDKTTHEGARRFRSLAKYIRSHAKAFIRTCSLQNAERNSTPWLKPEMVQRAIDSVKEQTPAFRTQKEANNTCIFMQILEESEVGSPGGDRVGLGGRLRGAQVGRRGVRGVRMGWGWGVREVAEPAGRARGTDGQGKPEDQLH